MSTRDLSPPRRHRYGGGYGYRRRRADRVMVAVVVVALGGGTTDLLQRHDAPAPARVAAKPCVTPTPVAAVALPVQEATGPLPAAATVRLVLLNGTPRNGLGRGVGELLAARGFGVKLAGNAPALLGESTVTFGPAALPGATVVVRHLLGAHLVSAPKAVRGSVRVVLGSGFARLRTPAEVSALALPRPASSPTPTTATKPVASAHPCP